MAVFVINDVELRIPPRFLNPKLREALVSGRYESAEAAALMRHLAPGDRLLDLGSGAGYLASLASRMIGGAAVMGVEAAPDMAEIAQANLHRNGDHAGAVTWGAVVADDFGGDTIALNLGRAFWASSVAALASQPDAERVSVPALRLGALLDSHRPTVLSVDVEGGELALFDRRLPEYLRLIVMEIHPRKYAAAGVKRIFDGLSASGLCYCPAGSRGAIVVFERVPG